MPNKGRTRASNGMGSIRKRADGRWEARYTAPDGKQKSLYGDNEKEVVAKLRKVMHEIDTGYWHEPEKMSVREWVTIWLRDYQTHTTDRTVAMYRSVMGNHVIPTIGSVKMCNLSQVHVRRIVSKMAAAGKTTSYIKLCMTVLNTCMEVAVESDVLKSNPVGKVKTPRTVHKQFTVVDRDLFPRFIEVCMAHRHGLAIIFLLLTGLRAGEQRGLQWGDIDFEASTMKIQRQVPSNSEAAFALPKYESIRTIEMPPEAMALLRQQKRVLTEMRMAAGTKWKDTEITRDLVFRTMYGGIFGRSTLTQTVKAIGEKIGLPALHPHDLRHSYAIAALRSGMDIKTVQNNMGHKSASVTLDIYAGYTSDAGRAGAVRFSSYWQDALGKNRGF